ncbi:hypothetical protein POX_b02275 [Penicillium oxalicum]|uniref:hypothetical protein n=1 Tax=Penicillium oxalicum TaxID=69781 RepID=UPI0020B8569B|nr:hypothetical protein POX_b02275 [Penicillium oxalicum]KAI2792238.1 hypothetical protein POX_b02275 [Penicillium oxalicum]
MVLSLPVPSFSRSSPPRPADDTSVSQDRRQRGSASSASSSSSRSTWKSPLLGSSASSTSTASKPPSITLSEALRNNPFGSTSRSRSLQSSVQHVGNDKDEQDELNNALEILASTFPDIRIEVFRELLLRFDGESRLHVCVDQLLRHKEKWVEGRWNVPGGQSSASEQQSVQPAETDGPGNQTGVPVEERFRSVEYKTAVQTALTREFGSLSKSTIAAVLAEVNFSYWRARPTLRDLSGRTWRATFNNILTFRRKKDRDEHPLMLWQRHADGELTPSLKETGSTELDAELHAILLAPLLHQKRENQESNDFRLASEFNELEAKALGSLYECECCLSDVVFEQIGTCTSNGHVICYHCIQRTVQEAIFGQGWAKSVDMRRSTLKCLAPLSSGTCDGSLPAAVVKQAVLLDKAGDETYARFEGRVASEALLKSRMKLVRCPFCSYAEADPVYHPSSRNVRWQVRRGGNMMSSILTTLFLLDLVPLLLITCLVLLMVNPSSISSLRENAIRHVCLRTRSKRFTCANPACQRVSCMTCQKAWRDPHVCHEPLLLDLRATVEAARTAAVKRTCPRCGLSFVKSSGCNKLTCVCGYSMCYLCRKRLGPRTPPAPASGRRGFDRQRPDAADGPADGDLLEEDHAAGNEQDENEEPEGAEDEESVARQAGDQAEREWHLRQKQSSSNESTPEMQSHSVNYDLSVGPASHTSGLPSSGVMWDLQLTGKPWRYWMNDVWVDGRWKSEGQRFVNWVAERVIVIDGV